MALEKQATTTKRRQTTTFQRAKKPVAKAKLPEKGVAKNPEEPRQLRPARYYSLRFKRRIRHPVKLASARKIMKEARQLIWKNWKVIGGIVLVYGIVNMVVVRGMNGGVDVRQLQQTFNSLVSGFWEHAVSGLGIFAVILSSTNTTSGSNNATVYQALLTLVVSLALIWAFRQLLAGKKIRIRDAYYRGMYPLIPVVLVVLVILLQLVPALGGGWLLATVFSHHIAITPIEKGLWIVIFGLLLTLSFYMVCSSFFAVYIATLADMTPMMALRSARRLVLHRRWTVMRKVLFLPFWLLFVLLVIMLPIIFLVPIAAQWVFFGLAMIALAISHAYMYLLYRELLREKN